MKSSFLKSYLLVFLLLPFFSKAKNAETDVLSYQIQLHVDPYNKSISGKNTITFSITKPGDAVQFKLAANLEVVKIENAQGTVPFQRQSQLILIPATSKQLKGDTFTLSIAYQGKPLVAKNPPWDGGFVWAYDSVGNPWVGMACEGIGASSWLPCKDTWDDEPSRVSFQLFVPTGLTAVSNGRLVQTEKKDNETSYTWLVDNPINHYNIAVNIGKYVHIKEAYINAANDTLDLDFYVLEKNYSQAKTHFQQTKRMLKAFEHFFGPYPFYKDGYKLVETPYWGMEHQSCVAYGNNYENNQFGFDFIIIHESGHEWFANSLTAKDKADMWIHESFTTYSESLFLEYYYGKARAIQYLLEQKAKIKNDDPIIGVYGTNHHFKDNDLYYKGAWILHTLRHMIDNDTLWLNTLRDLNKHFYHQTLSSKELEDFLSKRTRQNLAPFFEQYLRHSDLPVLEYYIVQKNDLNELHYRLKSDVKGLEMPLLVTLAKDKYDFITAGPGWKVIDLPYEDVAHFKMEEAKFLVKLKRVDPKK